MKLPRPFGVTGKPVVLFAFIDANSLCGFCVLSCEPDILQSKGVMNIIRESRFIRGAVD